MQPRSPVRTNIVIFTILGFVVALLIHFIVLSSPEYNWLSNANGGALLLSAVRTLFGI
ncbi:MAG: light-harvesting protein [Chloroflexus sp.]|nr:light-harvesting protein [Chloroflexus sp.]MBO9374116.1 light-harvesting protein [Chloroflexus sp.]